MALSLMNRTMKTVYDAAGGLDGLLKLASA